MIDRILYHLESIENLIVHLNVHDHGGNKFGETKVCSGSFRECNSTSLTSVNQDEKRQTDLENHACH
jgi:hypothetical protein